MLLIELGQVGQKLFRLAEIVVDIAVDQLDALRGRPGPAGRGDGRGALLADVDLLELVNCLRHASSIQSNRTRINFLVIKVDKMSESPSIFATILL